jgi:hypothetical protein
MLAQAKVPLFQCAVVSLTDESLLRLIKLGAARGSSHFDFGLAPLSVRKQYAVLANLQTLLPAHLSRSCALDH